MASLLELSHELLHCIFTEVDPVDLAALYFTCRSLNAYIRGNLLLHKELYLRRYDGETMVKSSSSGGGQHGDGDQRTPVVADRPQASCQRPNRRPASFCLC